MYNLLLAFIAMFIFSACGNYNAGDRQEEGSISFSLAWEKPTSAIPTLTKGGKGGFNGAPQLAPSPDVCVDYGLSTIAATVYNSANSQIANAAWQCSAHSGSISGVSPGAGIWIRLEGKDSGGTVQWRGDKSGITVASGQATSAGTVTMTYVGSDSTPPTVSSINPTSSSVNVPVTTAISAVFSENMAVSSIGDTTFTLKQGTTPISGAVSYDTASKTATCTHSANLAYSTAYTATITTGVKDMAGNTIANAYTWSFTTEASPVSAPTAPTSVSATAADKQVTISWTAVSGATSYNIYWSTTSGVTKSNGTPITGATNPYIHTGRANGTTYYYVVTAANGFGESGESSPVSAAPSAGAVVVVHVPDTGQTGNYTTTFGEDSDYTINPPSYTDNGDGTITDNVTGLLWQKQDDATTRTWNDAGTYCTNLSLAGTGWRLPMDFELMTIVDYGKYFPSIDTTYFPNTQSSSYWSSATYAYSTTSAWLVYFYFGSAGYDSETRDLYIRCVRGGQAAAGVFTDNGNGTVTDAVTTLVWQTQDDATTKSWEGALTYCEGLSLGGFTDWRLPNVKELRSIVDSSKYSPSINTTYFPNTQSSNYWSSTTCANDTTIAWYVNFYNGLVNSGGIGGYYARCVRGGQ